MVPKHVAFAPANKWGLAPFIPKASISSPPDRNPARSAFITVFHHTAFAKLGKRKRGQEKGDRLLFL